MSMHVYLREQHVTVNLPSLSAGNRSLFFHSMAIAHSVVDTTLGLREVVFDSKVTDVGKLMGHRVTSNDDLLKIFKGRKMCFE